MTSYLNHTVLRNLKLVPHNGFTRLILVVLTLVVLAIGFARLTHIRSRPFTGYTFQPDTGEVVKIVANSPAEGAGVRLGDVLLTIDGVPRAQARPLYDGKQAHDRLELGLLRNREPLYPKRRGTLSVELTLAVLPPAEWASHLSQTILAFAFWLLGVTVFWRSRLFTPATSFLLYCLGGASAIWVLPLAIWQVEWVLQAMYIGLVVAGAAFFHFHLHFPRQVQLGRALPAAVYLIGLVLTLLTIFVGPATLMGWAEQAGLLRRLPSHVVRVYFVVTMLMGLSLLVTAFYAGTGRERRQVRLVVFGTLVGFTPILLLLTAQVFGIVLPYDYAFMGLIAMPLSITVSLQSSDLQAAEARLFRILVYLIGALLLLAAYLGLTTLLSQINGTGHTPVIGAISSMLVALSFSPVQQGVQRGLNRLFYGRGYDYLEVVANSLRTMSMRLETVEELTQQIPGVLGVPQTGLWVVNEAGELCWRGGTLRSKEAGKLPIPASLEQKDSFVSRTPWFELDGPSRWWVPLILSDELQGLWVIGPRHDDESFSPIDQRLIKALARQAALVLKVTRLLDDLRKQLEKSEASRIEIRHAYGRLVEVREAEQKRIARELHDEVVQNAYGFTLFLQNALQKIRRGEMEEVEQIIIELRQQAREIGATSRRICHALRPEALEQMGLSGALRSLANTTTRRRGLPIKTVISPKDIRLGEEESIALYRIVQEALNNCLKHAQAKQVLVELSVSDAQAHLMIQDDGIGFDPASVTGKRLGLIGIRERVRAVEGTLTIDSAIGQGTTLNVQIPLGKSQNETLIST